MSISMRKVATIVSMLTFMGMLIMGLIINQPPLVCCLRAMCGAAVGYLVASVALRLIVDVLINVVAESGPLEEDEDG